MERNSGSGGMVRAGCGQWCDGRYSNSASAIAFGCRLVVITPFVLITSDYE